MAHDTAVIEAGAAAPDFEAYDEAGHVHRLKGYEGATLLLCFFPRPHAGGGGARDLGDAFPGFRKQGVFILGVQTGTPLEVGEFRAHRRVPFPILADRQGRIARAYGVEEDPGEGKPGPCAIFAVGPDGRIKKVLKNLRKPGHIAELLKRL